MPFFFSKDLEKEFQQLQQMMERSLEQWIQRRRSPFLTAGEWTPPMDIYETEAALVILVEIAGVKKEDLRVMVEGNRLMMTGYRQSRAPGNRIGCAQLEIDYGRFGRTIVLPSQIEREKITVTYQDGFLEIIVPRSKPRDAQRIEVQSI
jgi:HSP20 family protein